MENLTANDNILITMGIDMPKEGITSSFPAQIMPSLDLFCELKNKQYKTCLLIYQADPVFFAKTKGIPSKQTIVDAAKAGTFLKNFARDYLGDFGLYADVNIVTGKQCRIKKNKFKAAQRTLTEIAKGKNTIKYATANVMFNGGINGNYPLSFYAPEGRSVVIPMDDERSKPFLDLTQEAAKKTGCSYRVIPVTFPVQNEAQKMKSLKKKGFTEKKLGILQQTKQLHYCPVKRVG